MVQRTTIKNGATTIENRYFISSLPLNVGEVVLVVWGCWCVECFCWWLVVVFRVDGCGVLGCGVFCILGVFCWLFLSFLCLFCVGCVGVVLFA